MEELTLEKFEEASELVKDVTTETKLVYSEYFSAQTGNKVFFKPENMQYTGAYKVRGAYYKIHTLTEEEKAILEENGIPIPEMPAETAGDTAADSTQEAGTEETVEAAAPAPETDSAPAEDFEMEMTLKQADGR